MSRFQIHHLVRLTAYFAMLLSQCMAFASHRPTDGLWVTFEASGAYFQAVVTNPQSMAHVLKYVAGQAPRLAPVGVVHSGGEYNSPWSWHLDAENIDFSETHLDDVPVTCHLTVPELERTMGKGCLRVRVDARILRVQDCRSDACVPLRGLYAGRSPAM